MSTQQIWQQFSEQLFGFIRSRISNEADAQDLLQEVFVKVHLQTKTLRAPDKLSSWLYQITRNTLTDFYRKRKKTTELDQVNWPLEEEQLEDYTQFLCCLKPFIDKLDPLYQEALTQTVLNGLSQKAYAEQLGISYSGVKSRIQRARQQLKSAFLECCAVENGELTSKKEDQHNCDC